MKMEEPGATFKELARGGRRISGLTKERKEVLSSDVRCGKIEVRRGDSPVKVETLVKPEEN